MRLLHYIVFPLLLVSLNLYSQVSDSTKTVTPGVGVEASFPGGDMAWRKYLEKNANASLLLDAGAPYGKYTAVVEFVVNKDGSLSDFKVLTNEGYGVEEELLRLIKQSGNWIPANLNGQPVKAYRKQPMTFMEIGDDFDVMTKVPFTLFAGIENIVSVRVSKMLPADYKLTISSGSITPTPDGKYMAQVADTGRVVIQIHDIKKNKLISEGSFKVLPTDKSPRE